MWHGRLTMCPYGKWQKSKNSLKMDILIILNSLKAIKPHIYTIGRCHKSFRDQRGSAQRWRSCCWCRRCSGPCRSCHSWSWWLCVSEHTRCWCRHPRRTECCSPAQPWSGPAWRCRCRRRPRCRSLSVPGRRSSHWTACCCWHWWRSSCLYKEQKLGMRELNI